MSVIVNVFGYIEQRYECIQYNQKVLQEIDDKELDIFCIPKYSPTKGPDYIVFASSYDYLDYEKWIIRFENILRKLKAYRAFLFVDKELGKVLSMSYDLYYKFTKEQLDLGYSETYPHKYPMIFEILRRVDLKSLKNFEDVQEVVSTYSISGE